MFNNEVRQDRQISAARLQMCNLLLGLKPKQIFGTEMQKEHFQNAFLLGCGIKTWSKIHFSEITISLSTIA